MKSSPYSLFACDCDLLNGITAAVRSNYYGWLRPGCDRVRDGSRNFESAPVHGFDPKDSQRRPLPQL